MSRRTLSHLRDFKKNAEKIAVLTAYDATFARLQEQAGTEIILIGDSLGMVCQGRDTTLPVTVDEMVYHTASVARGTEQAFLIADMPFMSHVSKEQTLINAGRLMAEGGAQMVKLEGGTEIEPLVRALSEQGIPVCAHLGLLPQSVHRLGGYKVQGRDEGSAVRILNDARVLESAGAEMLVLECVPATLGRAVTSDLTIPVIGIGAGADTDGQVLVMHDMLGLTPGKRPRFCANFMTGADSVQMAFERYVSAVKSGVFPNAEQQY